MAWCACSSSAGTSLRSGAPKALASPFSTGRPTCSSSVWDSTTSPSSPQSRTSSPAPRSPRSSKTGCDPPGSPASASRAVRPPGRTTPVRATAPPAAPSCTAMSSSTERGRRTEPGGERVQKVLARAGVGSRRVCDELVAAGRVDVNGAPAKVGQRVDPRVDRVAVDGVPVAVAPDLVYLVLNKPAGVVTTASDPQGRTTVLDLVPATPRVFPVGRLDFETEGLILLTNDGELAHRLTHPSRGVPKEYLAEVEGSPGAGALRRLLEAVGHPVRRLVRTRIGPLSDSRLVPGGWRALDAREVRALYEASAAGPGAPPRAAGTPPRGARQGR